MHVNKVKEAHLEKIEIIKFIKTRRYRSRGHLMADHIDCNYTGAGYARGREIRAKHYYRIAIAGEAPYV